MVERPEFAPTRNASGPGLDSGFSPENVRPPLDWWMGKREPRWTMRNKANTARMPSEKAEATVYLQKYSCMQVRGPWRVIHAATATYLTLTGPRRATLARPAPARERYPKRSGRMRAKRLERQAYAE